MRPLLLALLPLAAACGEESTRPAECKAFVDSFNAAMEKVHAATGEEAGAGRDLATLATAMRRTAEIYEGLDEELAARAILDEQLKLRVEAYQGIVRATRRAAGVIAAATSGSDVFPINQAQVELQELARKERAAVAEITEYCQPAP